MLRNSFILQGATALLLIITTTLAGAEAPPQVTSTDIGNGLHVLQGSGGNMLLSTGSDGAFLIDDDYAPTTPAIRAVIASLTDRPLRFVANTHWHGDHTGGNASLGESGAIILAHENVRKRLASRQFIQAFNKAVEPSPESALPVITFSDSLTLHWNDEEIRVIHVPPAHTDGDSIVHFPQVNVLHTGDIFFNGMYPFIDVSSGGNMAGMIAAVDRLLGLADKDTIIVPGHGPVSNKAELQAYRDMLAQAHEKIRSMKSQNMKREAVIAAKPTATLDAKWGQGFMKPDKWVGIVYDATIAPVLRR